MTMQVAGRTLEPAVLAALTYWPGIVDGRRSAPADLTVLPPFFDALLGEIPWWDGTWRVVRVEPAYPREITSGQERQRNRFTEVSVAGTVGDDTGEALPFSARVRFEGDRLLRFQMKIGDLVVGPAVADAGRPEPHPFGAVLSALMDNRGVTVKELAMRTARAMATIHGIRTGGRNPHPVLVREIAEALGIPPADLAAIAGVDEVPDGR